MRYGINWAERFALVGTLAKLQLMPTFLLLFSWMAEIWAWSQSLFLLRYWLKYHSKRQWTYITRLPVRGGISPRNLWGTIAGLFRRASFSYRKFLSSVFGSHNETGQYSLSRPTSIAYARKLNLVPPASRGVFWGILSAFLFASCTLISQNLVVRQTHAWSFLL